MINALTARVAALEGIIRRLDRQSRNSVALSRSTAAAIDTGAVQTNQGMIDAVSLRDNMPTLFAYGFSSSLPVGGDKAVMFLNGDRGAAIVVATGHQMYRFTGLGTGETVMHDMWGRSLHMSEAGIVVQGGAVPITVISSVKVRFQTPLLECTGDIQDNCDAQARTMAAMREIHNLHTHTQPADSHGDAEQPTNPPTQQE